MKILKRVIIILIGLLPLGIGLLDRALAQNFGFLPPIWLEMLIAMGFLVLWAVICFNSPRYFWIKNEASLLLNLPGILILVATWVLGETAVGMALITYFLPLLPFAAPIPQMFGLSEAMVLPFAVLMLLIVASIAERVGRRHFPDLRYADYERHMRENDEGKP